MRKWDRLILLTTYGQSQTQFRANSRRYFKWHLYYNLRHTLHLGPMVSGLPARLWPKQHKMDCLKESTFSAGSESRSGGRNALSYSGASWIPACAL